MSNRDRLVDLIMESVGGCAQHWAEVIADHLIENGVTISKQGIWIDKDGKNRLFADTFERSCNMYDEELIDWMNYAFSADNLERYCLGDTEAPDSAYESIGKQLRNEYRQWCNSRRRSS